VGGFAVAATRVGVEVGLAAAGGVGGASAVGDGVAAGVFIAAGRVVAVAFGGAVTLKSGATAGRMVLGRTNWVGVAVAVSAAGRSAPGVRSQASVASNRPNKPIHKERCVDFTVQPHVSILRQSQPVEAGCNFRANHTYRKMMNAHTLKCQ
jgi:hypothetical protein